MAVSRSDFATFTVSGPGGVDRTVKATRGAALSLAQTFACQASAEGSFYVRDAAGVALYRVERDAVGVVHTYAQAGQ